MTSNFQWVDKGYPGHITDPAPVNEVGGRTRIDSIQNVLLLRADLHNAWDNYKFAVNPDVRLLSILSVAFLGPINLNRQVTL